LQILYATEGENKKLEEEKDALPGPAAAGVHPYKGHDFLQIHYRTPTNCESCNKTLWHMIHPPTALECRSKSPVRLQLLVPGFTGCVVVVAELEDRNQSSPITNDHLSVDKLYAVLY